MDCTATPIVCRWLCSEVVMTEKVVGSDSALQARNKNEPSNSASQFGQIITNR